MNECIDDASEGKWVVDKPIRCQRATAMARKQFAYMQQTEEAQKDGAGPAYEHALIWGAHLS
jgi:hypothetical protein